MAFYIGNSGYEEGIVYFSFDLRPGNQAVSVEYGNDEKSFVVAMYKDPIHVLYAYHRLLPMFEEIQSQLPESHQLIYRIHGGELRSKSYSMEITDEIYQQHFNSTP